MPDLYHVFGQDLAVSASGDLAMATGSEFGQQRVLRRLLTNPGSYIWQLEYGAGLARFIGQPTNAQRIAAVTRAQMYREAAVTRNPAPLVNVDARADGTVTLHIQYADAPTGQPVVLTLPLGL